MRKEKVVNKNERNWNENVTKEWKEKVKLESRK